MGTRNLTAVMKDGEYKIAQYGQWDGYPEGQGMTILEFLTIDNNIEKLRMALDKVRFLEPERRDKEFLASYEANAPEWSSDQDNRTADQKRWFHKYVSRDIGGGILKVVSDSIDDEILLKNSIGFAGDSLMCEYAYVIDFDKNKLEIYKGFNSTPIFDGRFRSDNIELEKSNNYEPITLIKDYPLDALPDAKQFLADLVEDDED